MAKLRAIPNLFNGYKRRYFAQKDESIRLNRQLQECNLEILTLRDEVTKLTNQQALHLHIDTETIAESTEEDIKQFDDFMTAIGRDIDAQMDELDALIARISKP
jgi:hypothetical protein